MEIRGRRECHECGRVWSYYETGSVACPDCGGLRSVGVDERTRHTATPVDLDLSPHRSALGDRPLADLDEDAGAGDDLKAALREYVRKRGFVDAGELLALDDEFLAAHELLHAVDLYGRIRDPADDARMYVLDLLNGADDGRRPAAESVPRSMRAARGLGYAEAVGDYRREVTTWLEDHPDPAARKALGTLAERAKRVSALQGDVAPTEAEALVRVAREIAQYLTEDDEAALTAARDRLSRH